MVFVLTCDEVPDENGELLLSAVKSLGMPSVVVAVQGMEAVPQKKKGDVRKALMKYMSVQFPKEDKFYTADTEQVWFVHTSKWSSSGI